MTKRSKLRTFAPAIETESAWARGVTASFWNLERSRFPAGGRCSSSASFRSISVLVVPVSSVKLKGPAPLIVTGTTIMDSSVILNLTWYGCWPKPDTKVESDKPKQRSARRRLDSRKEFMVLTSNREHRVSTTLVQVPT